MDISHDWKCISAVKYSKTYYLYKFMNDVDVTCDVKNKLSEVWFFIIFTFHFKLFFAMGVWWWGRGILVLVTGKRTGQATKSV